MKKTIIKIFAISLVAVMLCLALVSCGKTISGKYSGDINLGIAKYSVTYEFKGKNVEVTHKTTSILGNVETATVTGEYEINDNEITFTWDKEDDVVKGGTYTFEETENGIKIGIVEYKKAD